MPSATSCGSCYPHSVLSSGTCICDAGFYLSDASPMVCSACSAECLTCSGPSPSECLSCTADFTLTEGVCKSKACEQGLHKAFLGTCTACHPNCRQCFGPSNLKCIECAEGFFMQPYTDSVCFRACPTGSISQGTSCSEVKESQATFSECLYSTCLVLLRGSYCGN
jgi:proprotein convertase subtilisin/kexin type 5